MVSASRPRKAKKRRRAWSADEEKHLKDGIEKHGPGKWKEILEDPGFAFDDRTVVNLKDKFRSMASTWTYANCD